MTPEYDLAQLLPHRPPFLLLDRVRGVDLPAGRLVGERLVSAGDPLLPPGADALSPLLVVEALCQAAACLNGMESTSRTGPKQHRGYLVSATGFEFPDTARVGERLTLSVEREGRMQQQATQMLSFQAAAHAVASDGDPGVGSEGPGRLVARGRLLFAVTLA